MTAPQYAAGTPWREAVADLADEPVCALCGDAAPCPSECEEPS
jgi:hypothetical protein